MPSEHVLTPPYPEGVHTEYLHPLEIVDPVKNLSSLQIQRTYATCICSLGDGRIVVGWKNFSQYSSSGEYIRTIGSTLTIWNPATREYQMLEGHTSNGANSTVLAVCVLESAQGLRIVSGSQDNTLRVWDAATGVCLRVLEGHTEDVTSVCALDSTGVQRIVSGSDDNTLRVWDPETGVCLRVLKANTEMLYMGYRRFVTSICAIGLPGAQRIVSGSDDNTLRVWDPETGVCLRVLKGHTEGVSSVCALDSTGVQRIVSGSYDRTIRVWDPETGVCLRVLKGHTRSVISICAIGLPGAQRIVSGSYDRTIRVWDIVKEYPKVLKIDTGYLYPDIVYAPLAGKPDSLFPANTFLSESNSHLYLNRDISKIERWDITNLDSFPVSPPSLSKQFTSLFTTSKTPSSAKIAPAGGTRRVKKRSKRKTRARSSSRRAGRT